MLYVTAHKDPIKLVIEWMLAGGVDSHANGSIPYPYHDPLKLLCLNKLVAFLKIESLEIRTLKRIDGITRNQPQTFEQMIRLFSVASIPSQTHNVLQRNLSRWVAALSNDEWKQRCSQASTHSEQKPAVALLGKIRLTVEENCEKNKSMKSSGPRGKRSKRTNKKATPLAKNETQGNATGDNLQTAGRQTGVATKAKLESTQKWMTGLPFVKTDARSFKPRGRNRQQGELVAATDGKAEPMAKNSTNTVRDTVGPGTERRSAEQSASKHVAAMVNSKRTVAPVEHMPGSGRGSGTKPVGALNHDIQKPLK